MRFSIICLAALTLTSLVAISRVARSVEGGPAGASSAPATVEAAEDPTVAQLGGHSIRLSRVAERLSALAPFQRQALGASPVAQAKQLLETVLLPEALLAEQGRRAGIRDRFRLEARRRGLLKRLLVAQVRAEVVQSTALREPDVRAYFEKHPELFATRAKIRLQRLLVGTEAEARELIAKVKAAPTMDDWRNLVREKSLDKATSERGGELGFVAEDGSTDIPELEVDKALYAAAQDAKDGELLPLPIAEGKRFAVLWRRGSRPEQSLKFADEAPQIREYLTDLAVEERLDALVAQLRKRELHDYNLTPLEGRSFDWIFAPSADQAQPSPAAPAAPLAP